MFKWFKWYINCKVKLIKLEKEYDEQYEEVLRLKSKLGTLQIHCNNQAKEINMYKRELSQTKLALARLKNRKGTNNGYAIK